MSTEKQQQRAKPGRSSILHASYGGLFVILIIFLFLSSLYSLIVPITQGEDELAHYRYISFIAQNGRLPLNETERKQAWYRADWPPLYHLLVGWAVSPLDTSHPQLKDVGESPRRRLVGEIFYPRLIIYTEDASWPWQDGILAWHTGRFISILFSAGALVLAYITVLELKLGGFFSLKSPHTLALAVTGLLAFNPRYLFTSAMLGDDSLFALVSAAFIWLLLRAVRGDDHRRIYAGLGVLLGLSITTKYSTGLLPLVIIPVVWWRAGQAGWPPVRAWGRLGLAWLFTLLASSWWFGWIIYYFNTIERDGPVAGLLSPILATGPDVSMRRVFSFLGGAEFSGPLRPEAVAGGSFGEWWIYLFQTFWGVPVLEHDPLFPWAYLLILFFCLAAVPGLWHIWRTSDEQGRVTLGVLALIVALLFLFPILRYFLTFNILETGQGRHILYPAAQAIPILLALGWLGLSQWKADHIPPITHYPQGAFGPVLLLTWSLFQLVYMAATYPAPLPIQTTTFNAAVISQPLKQNFGEAIQLLGYDFQPDPEEAKLRLTLFWKGIEPVDENYRTQVQFVDPAGKPRFTWLGHPLDGRYPTRAWDKGDIIRDTLLLPLVAIPANRYELQLDLLREAEDSSIIEAPVPLGSFELEKTYPPASGSLLEEINFQFGVADEPVRNRQTLPLAWVAHDNPGRPGWVLRGPDNLARYPARLDEATAMFIVGANWPSGSYRLGLESAEAQSEPLLTVANEARLFEAPADLVSQPGWRPVEANFANQIKLLGYIMPDRRFKPGEGLPVTLAWQSLAPVLPDAITFAVLLDAGQQAYGQVDRYPAGFYSPMLWAEGEIALDSFSLPIRPDAPPGIYFLHLGQYQLVDGRPESLALVHEGALTDKTAVVIGPFKVGGPPPDVTATSPAPQVVLNQPVGDQITLLGYDLTIGETSSASLQNSESPISPSFDFAQDKSSQLPNVPTSHLQLILYWQAETEIQTDYTTFLHLRSSANEQVAQKDSPPAAGRYPTSLWSPGEVIADEIILPLDQLAPGEYTAVVGLYEPATGARLAVPGHPANEVPLPPIRLEE
jgi:hypothetical protein